MVKGNRGGRPYKANPEIVDMIEEVKKAKEEGDKEAHEKARRKLRNKMRKETQICGALKGDMTLCNRRPVEGKARCHWHGGKSTGATTPEGREKSMSNLNPKAYMIHGLYSKDFKSQLTQEETEMYNYFIDWFFETYPDDTDPINLSLFDRFLMNKIKQARKDSVDFLSDSQNYNDFEVKLIRFAETLGLNRKFNKSRENSENKQKTDITMLFQDDE